MDREWINWQVDEILTNVGYTACNHDERIMLFRAVAKRLEELANRLEEHVNLLKEN